MKIGRKKKEKRETEKRKRKGERVQVMVMVMVKIDKVDTCMLSCQVRRRTKKAGSY